MNIEKLRRGMEFVLGNVDGCIVGVNTKYLMRKHTTGAHTWTPSPSLITCNNPRHQHDRLVSRAGHLGHHYEWQRAACSTPPTLLQKEPRIRRLCNQSPKEASHSTAPSLLITGVMTSEPTPLLFSSRSPLTREKKTVRESKLRGLYGQRIFHCISFLRKPNGNFP